MKLRPIYSLLIGLALCIAVGLLAYFLLIGPRKAKVDETKKEVEETERLISTEKSTNRQLLEIKGRSAEYEAKLASLQAKIPEEPELPSLIRQIQVAADPGTGAGLPWLSFSPSEVQSSGTGNISSYSFDMTVAGFYDEVVDLIYRMERFPRAVMINSVDMTPTTNILGIDYSPNLGLVDTSIDATTYTFYSEEVPEEQAPAEEEGQEEELMEEAQ